MTQNGHGQQLVEMVAEEIKGRRQTHSCWLVEVIGAIHDVGAKALGEAINCHLQLALPSKGTEKVELHHVVNVHQVVRDQTDQAKRTMMRNVVKEIDTDGIESLRDIGRFT
jgi:hypothetical protein